MRGALANPYVGLRPFEEKDARYFFGRDGQVDPMVDLLAANRFLGVVGVSGSGKSSLVRAGLLPALHAGGLPTGQREWVVVDMKPRSQPIRNLAEALARSAVLEGAPEELGSREDYAEAALRHSSAGLAALAGQPLTGERANAYSLLVLVDQFEEIFRFARLGSADEADQFIQLLLSAADQRLVPVYVVLTMRSDFLGDCARFRGLPEHLNRSQYIIPRLERKDLRAAIEGPARLAGMEVDPALVTRLLNDLGEEPNRLPLLQHALRRLWDRWEKDGKACRVEGCEGRSAEAMPLSLYVEEVGTLDGDVEAAEELKLHGALHRHAQEVYESLPDEASRSEVEQLFKALTELAPDNRPIRRPETAQRLAALLWPSLSGEEALQNLTLLTLPFRVEQAGFLTPASPPVELESETSLDISHESLISHWGTLKHWVREEAEDARQLRRVLDDAERGMRYDDAQLEKLAAWWDRRCPDQAWAERYVPGQWDKVEGFYREEQDAAGRRAIDRKNAEDRAIRDATRVRHAVIGVVVLLATAFAVSTWYFKEAKEAAVIAKKAAEDANLAKVKAQDALALSFVRTIGRGFSFSISDVEWDALWELATLDGNNEIVRVKVQNAWFQPGGTPTLAQGNEWAGLRAAVGLDRSRVSWPRMADAAVTSLIASEGGEYGGSQQAKMVGQLVKRIDSAACTALAEQILAEMKTARMDQVEPRRFILGDALAALLDRVDDSSAGKLADSGVGVLLDSLRASGGFDANALYFDIGGLRRLCRRLTPVEAESLLNQKLVALRAEKNLDYISIGVYVTSFETLADRVNSESGKGNLVEGANILAEAIEKVAIKRGVRVSSLREMIKGMSQHLSPEVALKLSEGLFPIPDGSAKPSGINLVEDAEMLDYLVSRLDPHVAVSISHRGINHLASVLELNPDASIFTVIGERECSAYRKLIQRAETSMVRDTAERVLKLLETQDEMLPERLDALVDFLDLLQARLDTDSVKVLMTRLANLVEDPHGSDIKRIAPIAKALSSMGKRVELNDRISILQRVADQMKDVMTGQRIAKVDDLVGLARSLRAVAECSRGRIPESQFQQSAEGLLSAMTSSQSIDEMRVSEFGRAVAELAGLLESTVANRLRIGAAEKLVQHMDPTSKRKGDRLAPLGSALLATMEGMDEETAELFAQKGWNRLVGQNDSECRALMAGFARRLPGGLIMYREFALEWSFEESVPEMEVDSSGKQEEPERRRDVRLLCEQMDTETLVDMLKWPSCGGEKQKIVLKVLEQRLGAEFNGDVWKFVEKAPGLGIKNLERPPRRPDPRKHLLGAAGPVDGIQMEGGQ
ncbi:ATP-binding protein [Verrucomicrobium sp. BvORR106]|uniref:ATP-binding protein n=1 Tax=Verrucomicrobium sp. BvORR106 TaxID=1403819 RepID=UPI00068EBEAE|nr:ATP-binding protein [Verrucomicrobium sp. BvORR106]